MARVSISQAHSYGFATPIGRDGLVFGQLRALLSASGSQPLWLLLCVPEPFLLGSSVHLGTVICESVPDPFYHHHHHHLVGDVGVGAHVGTHTHGRLLLQMGGYLVGVHHYLQHKSLGRLGESVVVGAEGVLLVVAEQRADDGFHHRSHQHRCPGGVSHSVVPATLA